MALESDGVLFTAQTEEEFGCAHYMIGLKGETDGKGIEIKFKDAMHPGVCMDAYEPARAQFTLNLSQGNYPVEFRHNGKTTTGTLTIDTAAVLTIPSPKNVKLKF